MEKRKRKKEIRKVSEGEKRTARVCEGRRERLFVSHMTPLKFE